MGTLAEVDPNRAKADGVVAAGLTNSPLVPEKDRMDRAPDLLGKPLFWGPLIFTHIKIIADITLRM